MNRDFCGTFQDFCCSESNICLHFCMKHELITHTMPNFHFFCSFSWLASSYKMLFFSSFHLLVYDKNQWKLKPSTVIYKMQLLYTTHSKTPVVYMLRHNLCHLPPERYWSYSVNILQKGCWVQAQGNMWLLGLIYNLINNDLFLELYSLLHCFLWRSLLSLHIAPVDFQRPSPILLSLRLSGLFDPHKWSCRRRLKWPGRISYYF